MRLRFYPHQFMWYGGGMNITRRTFLKWGAAGIAGASLADTRSLRTPNNKEMPTRPLGDTGHDVSLFSLGGEGVIKRPGFEDESLAIIDRALDLGVNYIDTAPSYGSGISERNIGRVMNTRRSEVFLATKTHDRSYDGTMRLFEASLNRLQTDYVDLYQLHNLRVTGDLERTFARNGAYRALESLKEQKVVKHIGLTGHRDPVILRRGIETHRFDCILISLNAADSHAIPFQDDVLPAAVKQGLGIIAMKVPAHGRILRPDGVPNMKKALGYVWTFPVSTAIVGISEIGQLEENVALAKTFAPFSDLMMQQVASLTKHYHEDASWFKYHW